MVKWLLAGIMIATVLAWSGAVGAEDWTKIGTSGFTVATPSSMQDWQRIKFNSIAFDSEGRIYATACNGNNNGASGGLTIFQPNGTKIVDLDLNALGYPGAITKLVTGGDGVVYGLQNWLEIHWSSAQNVNRILAIKPPVLPSTVWEVIEIWNAGVQSTGNRITGMTVGGDGNIYWTMNGNDGYWKYHFLWCYDVAAGTAPVEAPANPSQMGWLESSRMFNLEFVGTSPDTWNFGVVKSGGSAWHVDNMSWTLGREYHATTECEPGWGRDHITALAWDPVDDILWAGGRGQGSGPWSWNGGGSASVANGEMTVVKGSSTADPSGYYKLDYLDEFNGTEPITAVSIASRFKVNACSADYNGTILQVQGIGDEPWAKIVVSGGNFVLWDSVGALATLAPVVAGEYNVVYVAIDETTDKIECWWNGTKKYDGAAAVETYYSWSAAMVGAAVRDGAYLGTATIAFDWIATDTRRLAPGDPMPTALAYYMDGSLLPDFYKFTNIMNYWKGAVVAGFFQPSANFAWHTNDNDPVTSGIPNGGRYWVQSIATDPVNGEAWMTWNGEAGYNYDPLGAVWTRNALPGSVSALGYKGVPEAGAQTVALGFHGGKVYATTCNMTTGVYNVYSRTPGPVSMSISEAKQRRSGSFVSTNVAKLVTFPDPPLAEDYFYIEDNDRSSAIRVIADEGQPVATLGEKAVVEGRTGVRNGEAVIFASSVVTSTAGSEKIKPLAMNVRSVGGSQLGIQPPTLSGGSESFSWSPNLNTTGLLIRVVGTLHIDTGTSHAYVDDGSPFPIRIAYDYGVPGVEGNTIIVTGISGVAWDGAHGFRVIMPRNASDMRIL